MDYTEGLVHQPEEADGHKNWAEAPQLASQWSKRMSNNMGHSDLMLSKGYASAAGPQDWLTVVHVNMPRFSLQVS